MAHSATTKKKRKGPGWVGRERETGDFCWGMQDCKELACRGQCFQELIFYLFSSRDGVSSTPILHTPHPRRSEPTLLHVKAPLKSSSSSSAFPSLAGQVVRLACSGHGNQIVRLACSGHDNQIVSLACSGYDNQIGQAGNADQIVSLVCSGPRWSDRQSGL